MGRRPADPGHRGAAGPGGDRGGPGPGRRGSPAPPTDPAEAALRLAADAFVVRTPRGPDVVAGYPWFGAWSRDTMISYEGLFLRTGRADEGRELLRSYAATLSEGMLANTADTGRVEHNTADATLWFLHAIDRHVAATGDADLAAELIDGLDDVIARHRAGTRYGIRVDPADGLLTQGTDGYALTWMDAVVHGEPVTPRRGKAVELNALWINGLGAVAGLRERLGRDRDDLDAVRARAVEAFAAAVRRADRLALRRGGRPRRATPPCGPTSCWPTACPTRRCATSTRVRSRSGRPAGPC